MHMLKEKLDVPFTFRDCDSCTNWVLNLKFDPLCHILAPKDSPIDAPHQVVIGGIQFLAPFSLSYATLTTDIRLVHEKIVGDMWTVSQAKIFLCHLHGYQEQSRNHVTGPKLPDSRRGPT
jgi:hypothetical protein